MTSDKGRYPVAGGKVVVEGYGIQAVLDSNGQARIKVKPTSAGNITLNISSKENVGLVKNDIPVGDTQIPTAPTELRCTGTTDTSISLT